jgi:hypothetical protein
MKFAKATKFHRKSGEGLGINADLDPRAPEARHCFARYFPPQRRTLHYHHALPHPNSSKNRMIDSIPL